ncbi:hypothetical protein [Tenacibaculum jejuense]|uniref:Uncharacterized protein n=1 Tax=Tenacibaculum jejuense TaxID=584609 RepID=A0A238UB98_9FLAO|nr:hypothetical protein [Tenacibaculum jejuense]SNR15690.1 conserved protein of unknown function [Tenacibaculum jejuense]
MRVFERDMSDSEVEKVSKAYSKELNSAVFWSIVFIAALLFFNAQNPGKSLYKLIFNIPVFLMFLMQLRKITNLLFFDGFYKDLEQKKKIIVALTVSNKQDGYDTFDGPSSNPSIKFQKNPYFRSIEVSNTSYQNISIRNKVYFELSKHGKWIVNVRLGTKQIDYRNIRKSNFKNKN